MINTLKTVGIACGNSFENSHLYIKSSRVSAYNGHMTINIPIDFDIDCCPDYNQFLNAIGACEETVQISMLKSGRLRVKSGKLKFFIDCIDYKKMFASEVTPEGQILKLNNKEVINNVSKIIEFSNKNEKSSCWSNGLLFDRNSVYCTNNNVLIEMWVGDGMPEKINVPNQTLKKIIKIDETLNMLQYDNNSLTFHYDNGMWVKTQLLENNWPDVTSILDKADNANTPPLDFFSNLKKIKKFISKDGLIYLKDNEIKTSLVSEMGVELKQKGLNLNAAYNYKNLISLEKLIDKIDFSSYPSPSKFYGKNLRGVIVGASK